MKHLEIVDYAKKSSRDFSNFFPNAKCPCTFFNGIMPEYQQSTYLFLSLGNLNDLTSFLGTTASQLESLINYPAYKEFKIKKKKSGKRKISEPSEILKAVQRTLNDFLQTYYYWIKPAEVNGFVIHLDKKLVNCNIVENARVHVGKKHLLNLDIKDFFSSISTYQIYQLFLSEYFQFEDRLAQVLALLTTYERQLPTGAPTSPVLSNFICLGLDRALKSFADEHELVYSRYADDLTFSSDRFIHSDVILDVMNILKKHAFEINPKKIRMKASHSKQVVTGITVNDKVNVDRKLLKKVRAMLHDFSENGLKEATSKHFKISVDEDSKYCSVFINRLNGYINFIGQVRGVSDPLYLRLKNKMEGCFDESNNVV